LANHSITYGPPPRPCDLARWVLSCEITIALALNFFHSKSDQDNELIRLFGIVDTSASEYIRFGMDIMLHVLKNHPNSKIEWRINDPEYLEYHANRVAFLTPQLHVQDALVGNFNIYIYMVVGLSIELETGSAGC
jgi:hypothetical protein